MKTSLGLVVLVAVASSLATAGVLELLRGEQRPAATDARPTTRPPQAAPPLQASGWSARFDALEHRLAALELAQHHRQPLAATREDLHERLLDWVAEERSARLQNAERQEEEAARNELEFNARYRAHTLALEHGLPTWQETNMASLFFEIDLRAREIRTDVDLATDDPAEVERRWEEFDEWADRRGAEVLGVQLVAELFGDE